MKKQISKLLSIILFMIFSVCMFVGCGKNPGSSNAPNASHPAQDFLYERTGKYIYFGMYPQTIKADNVTVNQTPDANGYYTGSDGEKYVKSVVSNNFTVSEEYAYNQGYFDASNGTTMQVGQEYYFKLEKLKWRILEEKDGKALIICDTIVSGITYQPNYTLGRDGNNYATDGPQSTTILVDSVDNKKVYANNYIYSGLRKFLIEDFYNTAFSSKQKNIINKTTVDNSAATSVGTPSMFIFRNTEDYVFALSYKDMYNTSYGFNASLSVSDVNRCWIATDYAKSTYVKTITHKGLVAKGYEPGSEAYNKHAVYMGSCGMLLRSPGRMSNFCFAINEGIEESNVPVYDVGNGVAPALYITL